MEYWKQVVRAYEDADDLSAASAGHFFSRVYKVEPRADYLPLLAQYYFHERAPRLLRTAEAIHTKKLSAEHILPYLGQTSDRAAKRAALYSEYPMLNVYNMAFMDLLYTWKFQLEESVMKDTYESVITALQEARLSGQYLSAAVVQQDSSYAVNTAILSRHFGVADFVDDLYTLIQNVYFAGDTLKSGLSDSDMQSCYYTLTHAIIASSLFYEQFVDGPQWIIDFFLNNIEGHKDRLTVDIIAEVLLSLRLTNNVLGNENMYESLMQELYAARPVSDLEDRELLNRREHSYCLMVLLDHEFEQFSQRLQFSDDLIQKYSKGIL